MSLVREVLAELVGMFVADARLSLAILGVVGLAAALLELAGLPAVLGGAMLAGGIVAVLVESVLRTARSR